MIEARALDVQPCVLATVRRFIEQHHYSHSVNGVKVGQCFQVGHAGQLVGAVLFGAMSTTAWRRFGATEGSVLELRRLVLLDECGHNSETRVIGKALKWLRMNRPEVAVIVSYADPEHGHSGTIYRAANFTYEGLSGADTAYRDPDSGRTYHSRALRTKYKGAYKPFVVALRAKLESGNLEEVKLQGKHCYTYRLRKAGLQ